MKLRTKVMLILALTVILAMTGTGLFFFHQYREAFRDSVFATVNARAEGHATTLNRYLQRQLESAQQIGDLLPPLAIEFGDIAWIENYLQSQYDDFHSFQNGFFFLDSDGILRADYPPHPELRGQDFSFRSYFKRTMAEKTGIIGQPYRSGRTGKGVLTFTSYLLSSQGKPLGLIGCSTLLEDDPILSQIRTSRIGRTGYSYVYDQSRQMILHPRQERMLTRDVPPGANKMYDAALNGYVGAAETVNSKGRAMLVAFHPVPASGWIVGSQLPKDEAYAPLRRNQQTFILFVVLGSGLAAGIGLLFLHFSMRDLVTLEQITEQLRLPKDQDQLGQSELQQESDNLKPLFTHPEFGSLARTISSLYLRLGGALAETRQKTTELNQAYQQLKKSQSQILQQEKLASVGQLAAGIAHEINNPMGFITSNLGSLKRYQEKLQHYLEQLESWLQESADTATLEQLKQLQKKQKTAFLFEDIEDLLQESREGAERVTTIVQNLKSFSRVDQSKWTQADINACLDSTIAIAWNEIKYKATLEKDFGDLPPVPCYAQKLNQVFLNILVNAAQALENQGKINIRTWQDQRLVKVAISDTGPGIPESDRERIFEPFFTTKEVGKGTGLGMSISYDIIQEHRGQILLESEEGRGTTFTIELPLDREE